MRRSQLENEQFLMSRAQEMRLNPTEAERALAETLLSMGFQLQLPIQGKTKNGGTWLYILDAFHPTINLCVELDGSSHRNRKGRDRRRDTRLKGIGITTLRYSNERVYNDLPKVLEEIREAINGQTTDE